MVSGGDSSNERGDVRQVDLPWVQRGTFGFFGWFLLTVAAFLAFGLSTTSPPEGSFWITVFMWSIVVLFVAGVVGPVSVARPRVVVDDTGIKVGRWGQFWFCAGGFLPVEELGGHYSASPPMFGAHVEDNGNRIKHSKNFAPRYTVHVYLLEDLRYEEKERWWVVPCRKPEAFEAAVTACVDAYRARVGQ